VVLVFCSLEEARNLEAPWNDWRSEMQIITAPLLGCLMPVLAVLGLFWALWGCPFRAGFR